MCLNFAFTGTRKNGLIGRFIFDSMEAMKLDLTSLNRVIRHNGEWFSIWEGTNSNGRKMRVMIRPSKEEDEQKKAKTSDNIPDLLH
jgi:hypothetical protein